MLKFNQYIAEDKAGKSLADKASKSGIPAGILRKVYNRGVAAWKTGHRPGTTPEQWGHARVNSFVTKSSGTWGKADKDLAAKVRKEGVEMDELSMSVKDLTKSGLKNASAPKKKVKDDLAAMRARLNKEAKTRTCSKCGCEEGNPKAGCDCAHVDEKFVSAAQRKAVWANKADGGKGHPDNKKKVKNEAFNFRVNIDGFPEMFMSGNSPGEVKSHLRQLIKQPSMIKAVDRISKHDKKKELRKKAMGEGTMGDKPEWGTPEATKKAKKKTPGQKDEGILDTIKKGFSYVMKNDGGKSKAPVSTNRKSTSGTQNSKPSPSIASRINFGGKYSK